MTELAGAGREAPPRRLIGMSSSEVSLGGLLSSRARLRFPRRTHALTTTRRASSSSNFCSERQTVALHCCLAKGRTPNLTDQPAGLSLNNPSRFPGGICRGAHLLWEQGALVRIQSPRPFSSTDSLQLNGTVTDTSGTPALIWSQLAQAGNRDVWQHLTGEHHQQPSPYRVTTSFS